MKKLVFLTVLACALSVLSPATAGHTTRKGAVLLGGGPVSLCNQPTPPAYETHGIYSVSEACYDIPAGVNGISVAYTPVHPHAFLACQKQGGRVQIYGGALGYGIDWGGPNPKPVVFAPTAVQTFTLTWLHGPTPDWSFCGE